MNNLRNQNWNADGFVFGDITSDNGNGSYDVNVPGRAYPFSGLRPINPDELMVGAGNNLIGNFGGSWNASAIINARSSVGFTSRSGVVTLNDWWYQWGTAGQSHLGGDGSILPLSTITMTFGGPGTSSGYNINNLRGHQLGLPFYQFDPLQVMVASIQIFNFFNASDTTLMTLNDTQPWITDVDYLTEQNVLSISLDSINYYFTYNDASDPLDGGGFWVIAGDLAGIIGLLWYNLLNTGDQPVGDSVSQPTLAHIAMPVTVNQVYVLTNQAGISNLGQVTYSEQWKDVSDDPLGYPPSFAELEMDTNNLYQFSSDSGSLNNYNSIIAGVSNSALFIGVRPSGSPFMGYRGLHKEYSVNIDTQTATFEASLPIGLIYNSNTNTFITGVPGPNNTINIWDPTTTSVLASLIGGGNQTTGSYYRYKPIMAIGTGFLLYYEKVIGVIQNWQNVSIGQFNTAFASFTHTNYSTDVATATSDLNAITPSFSSHVWMPGSAANSYGLMIIDGKTAAVLSDIPYASHLVPSLNGILNSGGDLRPGYGIKVASGSVNGYYGHPSAVLNGMTVLNLGADETLIDGWTATNTITTAGSTTTVDSFGLGVISNVQSNPTNPSVTSQTINVTWGAFYSVNPGWSWDYDTGPTSLWSLNFASNGTNVIQMPPNIAFSGGGGPCDPVTGVQTTPSVLLFTVTDGNTITSPIEVPFILPFGATFVSFSNAVFHSDGRGYFTFLYTNGGNYYCVLYTLIINPSPSISFIPLWNSSDALYGPTEIISQGNALYGYDGHGNIWQIQ